MAQLPDEEILTVQEVSALLRLSDETVHRWARDGKLQYLDVLGVKRFRREDIEPLLQPVRRTTDDCPGSGTTSPPAATTAATEAATAVAPTHPARRGGVTPKPTKRARSKVGAA